MNACSLLDSKYESYYLCPVDSRLLLSVLVVEIGSVLCLIIVLLIKLLYVIAELAVVSALDMLPVSSW